MRQDVSNRNLTLRPVTRSRLTDVRIRVIRPRIAGPAMNSANRSRRSLEPGPPFQRPETRPPKIASQKKIATHTEKIVNATPTTAYAPRPTSCLENPDRVRSLCQHVVLDELERSLPEVGYLDRLGQDEVAVELQERDQVLEDQEVVERAELEHERCEGGVGEREQEERREPGEDHLGVRTERGLDDARPALEHQAIGRVHEERRRTEVQHEAGALDPTSIVHERHGMAELVRVRQDESEGEQDQGVERRVRATDRKLPPARSPARTRRIRRAPRAAVKTRPARVNRGWSTVRYHQRTCRSAPVQSSLRVLRNVSTRSVTLGRGRIASREGLHRVDPSWLEEPFPPQERDEVCHRVRVQVACPFEVLEDQFSDGQRSVHALGQLSPPTPRAGSGSAWPGSRPSRSRCPNGAGRSGPRCQPRASGGNRRARALRRGCPRCRCRIEGPTSDRPERGRHDGGPPAIEGVGDDGSMSTSVLLAVGSSSLSVSRAGKHHI